MNIKIDWTTFHSYVADICRQIANSEWRPDYIVGLTRGGLFPAVMISHYFNVPMLSLNLSLRDGGDKESNLTMSEDAFNRKNILIVDDINDSGATLNWLVSDWMSSCHPASTAWYNVWNNNVKFAVVVDNRSSKCNVAMDFVGFEIDKFEDNIWVEFPYETWWKEY